MVNQLNIFLLLLGSVQGLLVSLFLFRRRPRQNSDVFLLFFLIIVGLQLTFKVISKAWLFENVLSLYAFSYHLPLAAIPLLFLYVRNRLGGKSFEGHDLVHFVPFILFLIHQSLQITLGVDYYHFVPDWSTHPQPRAAVQTALLIWYAWKCWALAGRETREGVRKVIRQFLAIVFASETLVIAALTLYVLYPDDLPNVRLLFMSLTGLIYWITYKFLTQPDILLSSMSPSVTMKLVSHSKYAHSGLKVEEADKIANLLKQTMNVSKPYLNPDLTLENLAGMIDTPKHHLSQVINDQFKLTYGEFISSYRLEESKQRLQSKQFDHYSIAAIAFDSGFSSLSSFNDLFKKRVGMTPSKFRTSTLTGKLAANSGG